MKNSSKLRRSISACIVLALFLSISLIIPDARVWAQTEPVRVGVSSHIEESLQVSGPCTNHPSGTFHVNWTMYLAWDMSPDAPFRDPDSPQGHWEKVAATSTVYSALLLPSNLHWRQHISTREGCFHIAETRQLVIDQNWRVWADFHHPDGTSERIFSNPAQFEGYPELIPRTKIVPVERMTLTKDPINIATGEMIIQATDLSLDGRGPALRLARTYRSQSKFSGLFGYGWHSAYDANLTEDFFGNVKIFDEEGGGIYFNKNEDGSYKASPGSYAVLVKNTDDTYTVTNKHGIASRYGPDGRLSAVTDRNGNTLRFVFGPLVPDGTYIEDAGGRRILLTLDENQRIIAARDPAGRTVSYAYDGAGNLVMITDPEGNTTTYTYNAAHNITEMTNVNGHKTYFSYDSSDRAVMNWQDGDVNKETLSYPGSGVTYVKDASGRQAKYYFNRFGLVTKVVDRLGNTRQTGWGLDMNRAYDTDARGHTTTFEYDGQGNLTGIVDPLGARTSFTYTGDFNLVHSATDALGQTTTYAYDIKGNPSTVTDALGGRTQMVYDDSGNLIRTTDALSHTIYFDYDPFGQMTQITDALANETAFTYDMAGNNIATTDAQGHTTQFGYDALNRLMSVHFPDDTEETYAYDAFGNRIGVTDQKGRTTRYVFDIYERLIETVDPLGNRTRYVYDHDGNMTGLINANGASTTFAHDPLGRLVSETSSTGNLTVYTYDPDGNLTASTDPNGNTITYAYDAVSRLTDKSYADKTGVTYQHDALGRRITMTDQQGVTFYAYDALGRVLSVSGPEADRTIRYGYDALGNRTAMTDQDGAVISYLYDALSRQVHVADASGTTEYTYDPLSNITAVRYPNSASIQYAYDRMNRPLSVINAGAKNTSIASLMYTYDAAGMATRKENEDGSVTEYQYDALDRLTRETKKTVDRKGNETIAYDYRYGYDAVGNRLNFTKATTLSAFWENDAESMPRQVLDELKASGYNAPRNLKSPDMPLELVKNYRYDDDNRLLDYSQSVHVDSVEFPVETVTYAYDMNGNRRQEQRVRAGEPDFALTYYDYDYEGRLTRLEYVNPTDTGDILNAAFEYNGNGLRTKSVEGDTITRFYHDGRDVAFETDGVGETRRAYVRALGFPGGIGGLIAQRSPQEELVGKGKDKQVVLIDKDHYYHYDALGSVIALSQEDGYPVSGYEYDAYGNILSASDTIENDYLFSSKEFEAHAGLYFFGARYYDPSAGRWLTPDPMGFIDGPNVYAYVNNNPINWIDPWGLAAVMARDLDSPIIEKLADIFYGDNSIQGQHWQLMYNDGTNSGYLGDIRDQNGKLMPKIGADKLGNLKKYKTTILNNLNDDILRQAEKVVQKEWKLDFEKGLRKYKHPENDCHTYIDETLDKYIRLLRDQNSNNKEYK